MTVSGEARDRFGWDRESVTLGGPTAQLRENRRCICFLPAPVAARRLVSRCSVLRHTW